MDISNYPIYVYCDMIPDDIRILQREVITNFPLLDIHPVIFREEQYGVLRNVICSYNTTFNLGYDRVILFEEDIIVRPDFLDYFKGVTDKDYCFYNLTCYEKGNPNVSISRYRAFGNMLKRSYFPDLFKWVTDKKYIGRPTYDNKSVLSDKYGHDAIFTCYLRDNCIESLFADKHYVVHVGIGGIHYPLSAGCRQVRDKVFSGLREGWLHNMVRLVEGDYSKELEPVLCPRGFKYHDVKEK